MRLPKQLVDPIMKLSVYQAFYEKCVERLKDPECTADDIRQILLAVDDAMANYRNTPEYKKALSGKF